MNINNKKAFDDAVIGNRFKRCKSCGGKLLYLYSGIYECIDCKVQDMDEFGKIKIFLDKNGPTPAIIISSETGVGIDVINDYLRKGRLEIPENSPYYINCERCNTDIRYGRYCPDCVADLGRSIKTAFLAEDVGEKPKSKGKMRFLER